MATHRPMISILIATHQRREVVAHTLSQLGRCGFSRGDYQVIVVDNASRDGTLELVRREADVVVGLRRNRGSCAKAYGLVYATGEYVVFLDDDSFPRPGSLSRMIERFRSHPRLGAAGFAVYLPDGRQEASALPGVFVGAGVGFRTAALRQVGGLDRTFFMQAEEFDVCFRLHMAGWDVDVFEDLQVDHLKTPQARRSDRTSFLDVRNNLRVIDRYLPAAYREVYRRDWRARYAWLAQREGHRRAFRAGCAAGRVMGMVERWSFRRWRLSPSTLAYFFRWDEIANRMRALKSEGMQRIALLDFGKNVYPFVRGARLAGLEVTAIGDNRFAAPGRDYRGVPIVPQAQAVSLPVDAFVVANTAWAHAEATAATARHATPRPVFCWYGGHRAPAAAESYTPVDSADERWGGGPADQVVVGAT